MRDKQTHLIQYEWEIRLIPLQKNYCVKETDNHVLYRVTPVFAGKNLLVKGVQMEA